MKRTDLIKHLLKNRCIFIREGARHSVFLNPKTKIYKKNGALWLNAHACDCRSNFMDCTEPEVIRRVPVRPAQRATF